MLEKEYFDQLGSEVKSWVIDKRTQELKSKWTKIRDRNEALDCFGYTFAVWNILELNQLEGIAAQYFNKAMRAYEKRVIDFITLQSYNEENKK